MGVRGSFDTEALDQAARKLMTAAASLREMTGQLGAIPHGSIVEPVAHQLQELKAHGQQMIKDIGEQTDVVAIGLFQVVKCYRDLDESIINAFTVDRVDQ